MTPTAWSGPWRGLGVRSSTSSAARASATGAGVAVGADVNAIRPPDWPGGGRRLHAGSSGGSRCIGANAPICWMQQQLVVPARSLAALFYCCRAHPCALLPGRARERPHPAVQVPPAAACCLLPMHACCARGGHRAGAVCCLTCAAGAAGCMEPWKRLRRQRMLLLLWRPDAAPC